MAWRIHLELESGDGGAGLINGLSRHDWLRVESDGRRLSLRPAGDRHDTAVCRMLAEVTAHFPHAVSLDAARPRVARGRAAVRAWLGDGTADGFAVFSYGERGADRREVYCFRRPDDAARFGRRFL